MLAALAYYTADALVRILPERWSDRAARGVARAAHMARIPARRALERNLARLEPLGAPRLRERSRRTFEAFGLVVTDFLRLARLGPEALRERVEVRGAEHLETARREGRGCVLVSVHAGSWEWGGAFLAALGIRVHILARPHADARVERFYRSRRAGWGVHALARAPLWVEAAHALRRGDWVVVMADRAVPGMHGSLCAYAAALARRTDATILPVAMTRGSDGRHVLWCDAPIPRTQTLEGGIREALRRHLGRAPGQWFAFDALPDGLAPAADAS